MPGGMVVCMRARGPGGMVVCIGWWSFALS